MDKLSHLHSTHFQHTALQPDSGMGHSRQIYTLLGVQGETSIQAALLGPIVLRLVVCRSTVDLHQGQLACLSPVPFR